MKHFGTDIGDLRILRSISGTPNRMLARSCFNDLGQLVEAEKLEAILRWDRVEDAYNDFYDRAGWVPPGRLCERYCMRDMLDEDLYHCLMEKYGVPALPTNFATR